MHKFELFSKATHGMHTLLHFPSENMDIKILTANLFSSHIYDLPVQVTVILKFFLFSPILCHSLYCHPIFLCCQSLITPNPFPCQEHKNNPLHAKTPQEIFSDSTIIKFFMIKY
jgi:hypothetical protein